jgi:hypothetical protein
MSSANAEQIRPLSRDAGEGWSGGATSAVSSNRPPTWTNGAIAAGAWLAAAAITHFLPDIDDFERTGLLANVMATLGWGSRCSLSAAACWASGHPNASVAPGPG